MANSRKAATDKAAVRHLRGQAVAPPRTPGVLGMSDSADPSRLSLLGDSPGPLGMADHGSPTRLNLPGMQTLHEWFEEGAVHLEPMMQVSHYYPAGTKEAVLAQASEFLARWEGVEAVPYVPGAASGVTIGVGYDIGQTSEAEFRRDWAAVADLRPRPSVHLVEPLSFSNQIGQAPARPQAMFPFTTALFGPLDRLAFAAAGKLSHAEAGRYVREVQDIVIPREMAIQVFETRSLPKYYALALHAMPAMTELPTGCQVALLSLVFNRGAGTAGKAVADDDFFDDRWEMRELRRAVLIKDLVWIYWHFESMRRLWATKGDATSAGLVKRRNAELALMLPYVIEDLKHEAFLQKNPQWQNKSSADR